MSGSSRIAPTGSGVQGASATTQTLSYAPTPRLLVGAPDASAAIINAIDGAQYVVDVELFSLRSDGSGRAIADAMERAVKRGVQVNFISDITGSLMILPQQMLLMKELKDEGINLKMSTRISPVKAKRYVDHRKSVAVDGKIAFVGGMNFGKMYDGWHDTMLEVHGADAAAIGYEQLKRWGDMSGKLTPLHVQTIKSALEVSNASGLIANTRPLTNAPAKKQFELTQYYYDKIAAAKHRILFESPGLSDQKTANLLAEAARRGVEVTFVSSGKPPLGLPIITLGTRSMYKRLIDAGAKVYETPGISHTKVLLVDDEVTTGSYNTTGRSALHDDELNVASSRPAVVNQFEKLFAVDIATSKPITGKEPRSFMQKTFDVIVNKFHINY